MGMIRLTLPDGHVFEFEDEGDFAPSDDFIAAYLGYSERMIAEYRREMQKLPSQSDYLVDGGRRVTFVGFQKFMLYRGTDAYKREKMKLLKMKSKIA